MARPSLLRNAICIIRRHTTLFNTSQCPTRIPIARINALRSIARYSSDNHRLPEFNQLQIQPKKGVKLRGVEEKDEFQEELEESLSPEQKEYMLPSQRRKQHEDLLLKKINYSETAEDLLRLYKQHSDVMNVYHILRAMKVLNNLVARRAADCRQLHENELFVDMCQRILKMSRRMEVPDLLSLLQYLCRLEVDVDSKLVQTVLQLLRHSLNDLDLREIIHLEFLLKKIPLTPLSHAILLAVPLLLENALNKEPLKSLSLKQLSQVLFLSVQGKIPNVGAVLQELYKRGIFRSGRVAQSFLWTLLEVYTTSHVKKIVLTEGDALTRDILLKECLEVAARNMHTLSLNQIETTLHKITRAYENQDFTSYNEHYLNAIAVHCIQEGVDFTRISHIIRKFLKMNYISEDLVDRMVFCILRDPESAMEASVVVPPLITAITASSVCDVNYLEAVKVLADHKSLSYNWESCLQMPSLNLALDLLSAGYYHQPLLELLTSADFLIQYFLKYSKNNISLKQLLQLNQILTVFEKSTLTVPEEHLKDSKIFLEDLVLSDADLGPRLHQIFGDPDFVVSGVLTDNYLYIDHLIIFDETNSPVNVKGNFTSERSTRICDLDIPESSKRVAVLDVRSIDMYGPKDMLKRFVRVNQELLKASGYIVVPVLESAVNRLTFDEKNLYIKSLIENVIDR